MKRIFEKLDALGQKRCGAMAVAASLFFVFAGTALASGGGGSAEPKGWVSEDTYRVMNFAVLAVALFYVLKKPVVDFFSSRTKGIESQLAELEEKKAEAENTLARYNEKIARLDGEAETIVAEYVKQGEAAKKKILEEAAAAAEKLEAQAQRSIEHEFKSAKLKLQEEIAALALAKAEELIKGSISGEDQDRLVDEYLEKVVA
jgi:F-type H+-transporting ATPase subunit b